MDPEKYPAEVSPYAATVINGFQLEGLPGEFRGIPHTKMGEKKFGELLKTGLDLVPVAVENRLFGESVTVSGLVSGGDILAALAGVEIGRALLVPDVMLKEGEGMFLDDLSLGAPTALAAARFHATVAAAVEAMVWRLHLDTRIREVALSGGVFQNRLLLGLVVRSLATIGLHPHFNTVVPANDGGISLGQAHLLRAHLRG